MEITLELIVFIVLALFTTVSALLAVTTHRILRAATYLLFVLFGTAGIYFQLNYSFLSYRPLLMGLLARIRTRFHLTQINSTTDKIMRGRHD